MSKFKEMEVKKVLNQRPLHSNPALNEHLRIRLCFITLLKSDNKVRTKFFFGGLKHQRHQLVVHDENFYVTIWTTFIYRVFCVFGGH